MPNHAAITINRPCDEVERLWRASPQPTDQLDDSVVSFADAPGGRGTEIHIERGSGGGLGRSLSRGRSLAKAKDGLRRFKQVVETGEVPRSDAVPEGERVERKLKQRPAQPLHESELEKAQA